jgi:predicted branched-subunit amino acid permease
MSFSLVPFFKTHLKNIFPSLLMLSGSSFTVSHIKFTSGESKTPFKYYLGVASAAYVTTFFSTLIGFCIAFVNNCIILQHVFSIALGIHFTALTAMRWPKFRYIASTMLGIAVTPLLKMIIPLNISLIITPIMVGLMVTLFSKQKDLTQ